MNTKTEAADLLEQGAEILSIKGWCQGEIHSPDNRHCALGALLQAEVEQGLRQSCDWHNLLAGYPSIRGNEYGRSSVSESLATAVDALWKKVNIDNSSLLGGAAWFVASWSVASWNNDPNRTAEDVIDAMRLTAKDLRNEATP